MGCCCLGLDGWRPVELRKRGFEPGHHSTFLVDSDKQRRLTGLPGTILGCGAKLGHLPGVDQVSRKEDDTADFEPLDAKSQAIIEQRSIETDHQALTDTLVRG
jgi:hypothetical protein